MEISATLIGSPDRMKPLFVVYFLPNSHWLPMASGKMSVLMQSLGYLLVSITNEAPPNQFREFTMNFLLLL
jgi:hypothetical protein